MTPGSVAKSGKPWAKLIARSGPLSSRFCRVISRMTDSAKPSAFSDSRAAELVPRIRTLQVDVGARARKASLRPLQPALPSPAHVARPARLGKEVEHVRAAQQADHLAAFDDGHTPDALAGHQPCRLVDACVLGDRDHIRAHDVAREPFLVKTSTSETMPTTSPSAASTGAPVIRLLVSVCAISSTGVSSLKVMTLRVITSLTGIMSV